jgi:hypothetical protein
MYSITYDLVTPESASEGGYAENGYVVEPTEGELQDILLESNRDYGIYKPVGVGVFVNTQAPEDKDYFEKGHEKYYTLTITKSDGSKLNQEELDFVTALLNEGKYYFDEESNRFYEWGGSPKYGIGGWIGGTLIGGFLGYQVGKAVGYGRAVRGYEGGGDIPSDYFDFQTVQYNDGGTVDADAKMIIKEEFDDFGDEIDSVSVLKEMAKVRAEEYKSYGTVPDINKVKSAIDKMSDSEIHKITGKFDNGGRVEYFDREDFYNKNPRLPRKIEISKSQYIKNKDFISKQKWARNIVDTQGYEDNNGVEFIEFDIEVNEKSSWDMWGWINENIPSSERKIFVQDKRFLEYSEGGEVRYFNRHENMGDETRREILEYTQYPILKEYFGKDGKDDTEYEEIRRRLEEVNYDTGFGGFTNYLYGMFDGFDYTKTKHFQEELAKIKKADPKFHSKIMRIVEEIQSYPTTEQPNNNQFGLGGLLLAGGFGAYVGYKIGRARPQKKGFDTEKKIAQKVKQGVKDVSSKKKPAKAYAGGGMMPKGWSIKNGIKPSDNDGGYDRVYEVWKYGKIERVFDTKKEAVEYVAKQSGSTYAGGGKVISYKFYDKDDYEDTVEIIKPDDLQEYLDDWNNSYETNYKNVKQFNKGEDYYVFEEIYEGGGNVVAYKYYDKDDYEDSVSVIEPDELQKFLDDWNSTMETNYKNAKEFNAGEDYYMLEEIYYGGGETITKPRPTITPTETPSKPDKDNPYLPKVKPKPKASKIILTK